MTLRGTASSLVVLVAVSSAAWNIVTSARATALPLPWVPMVVALLSHAVAMVAAVLVLRASAWWRRAALAYMAAFTALESVGLVQVWPFASQYETSALGWSVATSCLAVAAAVLCLVALRRVTTAGEGSVPGPLRGAAVVAGLLLVTSSVFAWSVSAQAPAGRWMFTLGLASTGVLVGSLVGMAVLAGITAVVAASSERSLVAGATAGLLASRPLTPSVFADPSWQDADAVLAAGWWIALVAQLLLVVVLVALLRRGVGRSHEARELAPTA